MAPCVQQPEVLPTNFTYWTENILNTRCVFACGAEFSNTVYLYTRIFPSILEIEFKQCGKQDYVLLCLTEDI